MITYHPPPGSILRCDFSGFKPPEMNKHRPVLVLSPRPRNRSSDTCIVAALSTTEPHEILDHHMLICLSGDKPKILQEHCWLKGDMMYTVAYNRLNLYTSSKAVITGKRIYWQVPVDAPTLAQARKCAASAIGLHS
jgi:mRNA interferase MazF